MTTLANEDWLKTRTWDMYRGGTLIVTVADLLWAISDRDATLVQQVKDLHHFMTLPAWQAAPEDLVTDVSTFLLSDAISMRRAKFYSDDEARDDDGRWTTGGGKSNADDKAEAVPATVPAGKPLSELRPLVTVPPHEWITQNSKFDSGRHFAVACTGGQVQLTVMKGIPAENEPTDEDAQRIASTIADLHDKYNPDGKIPSMIIGSSHDTSNLTNPDDGSEAIAVTHTDPKNPGGVPSIEVNAPLAHLGTGGVKTDVDEGSSFSPQFNGTDHNGQIEYVVSHEFGHVIDDNNGWVGTSYVTGAFGSNINNARMDGEKKYDAYIKRMGMSIYGASDPSEEFAEAFADWARSEGTTTSKSTRIIARVNGWPK